MKTRTEKRLRARDVTTTAAHLDARPLEEHVVYIAELFEDGKVVCSGEAAFERDAFTELDRAICRIAAAARAAHIAQIDALTEVRRWE